MKMYVYELRRFARLCNYARRFIDDADDDGCWIMEHSAASMESQRWGPAEKKPSESPAAYDEEATTGPTYP